MSIHEVSLTELERTGLEVHGLQIAQPSQLSDVFRLGIAWANMSEELRIKHIEQYNKKHSKSTRRWQWQQIN